MRGFMLFVAATLSILPRARAEVLVTLFDSAGLTPAHSQNLARSVHQVFADSGVAVRIVPCLHGKRRTGAPECLGVRAPNEVLVRIIDAPRGVSRKPIGWTAVSPDGGGYVTLYLHPTRRYESTTSPDPGTLLGYAAAHELGHLLLRTPEHSSSGLMKAEWNGFEQREMLASRLRFTPDELRRIRESLR